MSRSVAIVPTGTANLASIRACLRRLGWDNSLATSADQLAAAERVVLPGVGTFGTAMNRLVELDLVEALRERIARGRPTLAICVGMQLLATASEESPESKGLGVVPVEVTRFAEDSTVPQLGWNQVHPDEDSRFLTPGWAYFANSYRLDSVPKGWAAAHTDYGGPFPAAAEKGDVLACQFHPELSGDWGTSLVDRWLNEVMV